MKLLFRILAGIVAALFFYTGVAKGQAISYPAEAIAMGIPALEGVSVFLAWGVVVVELVLASTLVAGIRPRLSLLLSFLLGLFFIGWHTYLAVFPELAHCGCGAPPALKRILGDAGAGWALSILLVLCSGVSLILGCLLKFDQENDHEEKVRESDHDGCRVGSRPACAE